MGLTSPFREYMSIPTPISSRANKLQPKEVLFLLSDVLLFTFFILYTVINIRFILLTQCLIIFCGTKINKITFYLNVNNDVGK